MKFTSLVRPGLLLLAVALVAGCYTPKSFEQTRKPTWIPVHLRAGLDYETAWPIVVDALARKFGLDMISKDGAYIRTSWIQNWQRPGMISENYKVRAIVKFSPNRERIDVRTEAQTRFREQWKVGSDKRLMETVRHDLTQVVGVPPRREGVPSR